VERLYVPTNETARHSGLVQRSKEEMRWRTLIELGVYPPQGLLEMMDEQLKYFESHDAHGVNIITTVTWYCHEPD